jgi:hypothetical protein
VVVNTITAGFNGTSRYVIMNPESFGKDRQYNYTETNDGRATAYFDNTYRFYKNLQVNQWLNARLEYLLELVWVSCNYI